MTIHCPFCECTQHEVLFDRMVQCSGCGHPYAINARSMFKRGDRVQPSQEAIDGHIFSSLRHGTVVGFGRAYKPEIVVVLRDGLKTRESYHFTFWDHESVDAKHMQGNSQGKSGVNVE